MIARTPRNIEVVQQRASVLKIPSAQQLRLNEYVQLIATGVLFFKKKPETHSNEVAKYEPSTIRISCKN